MLNLQIQPFRLLTKAEAAHYCRRSTKKFQTQCPVRPIEMPDGDLLWDVQDLDRWIDGLKIGDDTPDQIVARLAVLTRSGVSRQAGYCAARSATVVGSGSAVPAATVEAATLPSVGSCCAVDGSRARQPEPSQATTVWSAAAWRA